MRYSCTCIALAFILQSASLMGQITLSSRTATHTYYQMGGWQTDHDSLRYIYSENNSPVLQHHRPSQNRYGYNEMASFSDYTNIEHHRVSLNFDNIYFTSQYKNIYENNQVVSRAYYSPGFDDEPTSYYNYLYEDNQLAQQDFYSFDQELQNWENNSSTFYSYNDKGEIIEKKRLIQNSVGSLTIFVDSLIYQEDRLHKISYYRGNMMDSLVLTIEEILAYNTEEMVESVERFSLSADLQLKLRSEESLFYRDGLVDSIAILRYQYADATVDSFYSYYTYTYQDSDLIHALYKHTDKYSSFAKTTNYDYESPGFVRSISIDYTNPSEYYEFQYYYDNTIINTSDEQAELTFTVSPNPAKEILHIGAKVPIDYIRIYSSVGKLVYERRKPTTPILSIQQFSPGTYYLQVLSDKKTAILPFIKD